MVYNYVQDVILCLLSKCTKSKCTKYNFNQYCLSRNCFCNSKFNTYLYLFLRLGEINMKHLFILFSILLFSSQLNAWTITKDFEDGVVGERAQSADSFDGTAGASKFSDVRAVSGNQSGEVNIKAGQEGFGQWGGSFDFPDLKDGDEIWFRVFYYFPTTFDFSAGGMGLKTMRIHTSDASSGNEGYMDLLIRDKLVVWSEVASSDFGANNPGGDIEQVNASGFNRNRVGKVVPTGTWHVIEQYVKFASKPNPGIYRVWQDGKLVFEDLETYTLKSSSSKSDFIYLFTNWNDGAPKTQNAYVDYIVITSEPPGTTDSFGNPFIGTGDLELLAPPKPPMVQTPTVK